MNNTLQRRPGESEADFADRRATLAHHQQQQARAAYKQMFQPGVDAVILSIANSLAPILRDLVGQPRAQRQQYSGAIAGGQMLVTAQNQSGSHQVAIIFTVDCTAKPSEPNLSTMPYNLTATLSFGGRARTLTSGRIVIGENALAPGRPVIDLEQLKSAIRGAFRL